MLKVYFAIIGLTFMIAPISLTNPCLVQQQSISGAIYNSAPKRYIFGKIGEVNVGEYELGKAFIADKDPADPPPK